MKATNSIYVVDINQYIDIWIPMYVVDINKYIMTGVQW